jgi:hypothetical protein
MKPMTLMLAVFALMPLAFAAWQGTAGMALAASFGLLGAIYAVGVAFGIGELQMTAKEELFQLIAMGIMAAMLVGGDTVINAISTNEAFTGSDADTLQEAARNSIDETLTNVTTIMDSISGIDKSVAVQGSKSSSCSILGMGYSVSGCGSYTMLATPLSMAGGITGFAVGELYTMKRLIQLSEQFAFPFLLPLGIVLRTFKFTRGAGGLLIALAISLHILLPIGIIFNDMLGATFLNPPGGSADDNELVAPYKESLGSVDLDCNAGDTDEGNENDALEGYNTMRSNLKVYLNTLLVQATLGPILALLMMSTGLRTLTSIMGAEVDVSAVSRFV